jgi:hypothetical protein
LLFLVSAHSDKTITTSSRCPAAAVFQQVPRARSGRVSNLEQEPTPRAVEKSVAALFDFIGRFRILTIRGMPRSMDFPSNILHDVARSLAIGAAGLAVLGRLKYLPKSPVRVSAREMSERQGRSAHLVIPPSSARSHQKIDPARQQAGMLFARWVRPS